ncbi:MAG: methionyl-tRNA formyltransferase [Chloroflexi bacterium]|nr:methionyl-tRNA formyltransferase [Chloroflexota bacterium]
MSEPAGVVFFGSGGFAVPILERLATSPGIRLVGVVTIPERPSGRGGVLRPAPVRVRADDLGLPIIAPTTLRDPGVAAAIAELRPDVGVLADYGLIVPLTILDLLGHGILNVHPSLLPRWRGASPIPAAILAGDPETGVTIIAMDAGIDTGPIVAAERWPLTGRERAPEVEVHAARVGVALVGRTLGPWLAGALVPHVQDAAAATMTRPLRRADGRLDPTVPARDLERRVRAFDPWPGTHLETSVGRLIVRRVEVIPETGEHDRPPVGTLVAATAGLELVTVEGRLRLEEVQPAGGRPMTGSAFARGRPAVAGGRVV